MIAVVQVPAWAFIVLLSNAGGTVTMLLLILWADRAARKDGRK
jgi:hypothetical protein